MTTLPVAEARAQLSKLVERAASTHERFEITRNGQRTAVLLGANDYDTLQETIAVLGTPNYSASTSKARLHSIELRASARRN